MVDNARYRFLPWTRRGLAGAIDTVDTGNILPRRAKISVGITVTNVDRAGVDLSLYGPGSVLGIDPRLIVKTTPLAGATNVEPNYFAAIEFDPPDFVWMFTPARANNRQRLRPWLVLIVVDQAVVKPPQMNRDRPLPTLTIPAAAAAQELPDLSESWAWAHTQLVTAEGPVDDLAKALAQDPDLNVSRLLCPRRLKPGKQYLACLVPAFNVGVERGLGGQPDPEGNLAPAWDTANPGEVVLPVYYHWEFATGPLGDFESLARQLKPFESPATVGVAPMFIGDGGPELPALEPTNPQSTVAMDGVLRAPTGSPGTLADIADSVRTALRQVLNAPAQQMETGPSDATSALGPPIYGQWHKNQHTIVASDQGWLAELNQDPRSRTAAGLGAEVVRKFQEDFMQACWEQVGDVLKANNRLNWGRLSLEANRHVYERHYQHLQPDRFLQMTLPLHSRTPYNDATLLNRLNRSSLPTALVDSAFRRVVSPQRSLLRKTVQRLAAQNRLQPNFRDKGQSSLLQQLSTGRMEVDPTRFTPDGLTGSRVLDRLATGELSAIAGVDISRAQARQLQQQTRPLEQVDFQQNPLQVRTRANLRQTGLITATQIDNVRLLAEQPEDLAAPATNIHTTMQSLLETARQNPNAQGVLVSIPEGGTLELSPVLVDRQGDVRVIDRNRNTSTIGNLDRNSLGRQANLDSVFSALPMGTFNANLRPNIRMEPNGNLTVRNLDARNLRNAVPQSRLDPDAFSVPITGPTSGLGTNPTRFPRIPTGPGGRPVPGGSIPRPDRPGPPTPRPSPTPDPNQSVPKLPLATPSLCL